MIYTSYFSQLKNLPPNIIPISICAKAPEWYSGLQYKKLAPKYDFFMKWKQTHDNNYYIECYNDQVLSHLSIQSVITDLISLVNQVNNYDPSTTSICLMCYEKPHDFCHRHLVAEWLKSYNLDCKEWSTSS